MSRVLAWVARLGWSFLSPLLLALLAVVFLFAVFGGRPKRFPPGPMILPVIGSFLSMPFGPTDEMMRNIRKTYGDIASFAVFGTRVVVVSSVTLIKEVFALGSTAGRPEMVLTTVRNRMITDGRANQVGIIGTTGQVWQEQRRFVLHHLRNLGFGKTSSEPIIFKEISELMDRLAMQEGRSTEITHLFNRSVINILWWMVMGKRYPHGHENLNKLIKALGHIADIYVLSSEKHIPYMLNFLDYIPNSKRTMKRFSTLQGFVKEEMKEFLTNEELRNSDSFLAKYMKEVEKNENPNFNMDHLAGLMYDLFVGGMETTSSTLTVAVNNLAKHQHVQRRFQEELDEVVGRNKQPSYDDLRRLPYVEATINEAQRVFSLKKFAIPHIASEDMNIGNYDIPKGTWLLPNLGDAHMNSNYWSSSKMFDPQNFLDEDGKFKKNDAFMPFGHGKRICPGLPLARMELFLFLTHLFQRFTFTLEEEHKPMSQANPMFNAPPQFTVILKSRL